MCAAFFGDLRTGVRSLRHEAGSAIGTVLSLVVAMWAIVALALHRVLEKQLHGLSAQDPGVFVLAASLRARVAARVDSLAALRQD